MSVSWSPPSNRHPDHLGRTPGSMDVDCLAEGPSEAIDHKHSLSEANPEHCEVLKGLPFHLVSVLLAMFVTHESSLVGLGALLFRCCFQNC